MCAFCVVRFGFRCTCTSLSYVQLQIDVHVLHVIQLGYRCTYVPFESSRWVTNVHIHTPSCYIRLQMCIYVPVCQVKLCQVRPSELLGQVRPSDLQATDVHKFSKLLGQVRLGPLTCRLQMCINVPNGWFRLAPLCCYIRLQMCIYVSSCCIRLV